MPTYAPKLSQESRQQMLKKPPGQRVREIGHRGYVGGTDAEAWYGIGLRQYQFLIANGLRHDHTFLDVACGSLRLGQYLIPYLDEGRYCGLEGEESLVKAGLEHEVLYGLAQKKNPRFAINYNFDLSSLPGFDFAIAQSLFTHLTPDDIAKCFAGLAPRANPGAVFFATYFEGDPRPDQDRASHAQLGWRYRAETLAELGARSGWQVARLGDWGHPRNQIMLRCVRD